MENWQKIESFESYEVSDLGNVRSLKFGKIKSIRFYRTKRGYLMAQLSMQNKVKKLAVHRLVAEAFIPNPLSLPHVNHLNGDTEDNRVSNLEWVNRRENVAHGFNKKATTSKYTGVSFTANRNKWRAQISIDKKYVHLGLFKTEEEAHRAYLTALETHNLKNKYANG